MSAITGIQKKKAKNERLIAHNLLFRSSNISLKNKFFDVITCHLRFADKDFFKRKRDQFKE